LSFLHRKRNQPRQGCDRVPRLKQKLSSVASENRQKTCGASASFPEKIPPTRSHLRLLRNCRCLSRRCVWVPPSPCSISQVGRQSFPHRPTHLNWFRPSSRVPPHSGQMQFAMADLRCAFDRIKLSTFNSFTEKKTGLSRGQSAHNICDALDLGAFLLDVDRFPLSRKLFLITCLSLIRALASRAFTVPVGTPRRCAVSRMLKPSTSRKRNVVRRVGESRTVA
jgi:hypothetical protein